MNDTKETRQATTTQELTETLRQLIRHELVGLTEKTGENEFVFMLPGGKKFRVCVQEL